MTLPRTLAPRALALTAIVGLVAVGGVAAVPGEAEAQSISRHRSASINGPHHSASRGADIYRSPGSASVHRYGSVDGHGWSGSRNRTTARTDDGFATHASRSGSGGRGYERDVDVRHEGDSLFIDRSITTNSGASRQSTVVRSR